jgi:hypothetical protein
MVASMVRNKRRVLKFMRVSLYPEWQIYMTPRDVRDRYGITNVTLLSWAENPLFPKSIPGHTTKRWRLSDMIKWENEVFDL